MFQGIYNGSQKHVADLDVVLDRAWTTGLEKIIITVGTVADSKEAIEIAQKDGECRLISIESIQHSIIFVPPNKFDD